MIEVLGFYRGVPVVLDESVPDCVYHIRLGRKDPKTGKVSRDTYMRMNRATFYAWVDAVRDGRAA